MQWQFICCETKARAFQTPCSAVVLWGWGPVVWTGAAASALIYCNPGMPEQIRDGVLSPACQAHLLLCQGHLPWRKEQTSGLGAAPSSLYVNKECFLSEIREQYVCRELGYETAGQEDVKPCQPTQREESGCWVGSQGFFLQPERFLPFSLGHPSIHSPPWPPKAPLSSQLRASPVPRAPWFLGDPSWASSFCRGLLAKAHPASFLPLQHLITPGSQSLWWV